MMDAFCEQVVKRQYTFKHKLLIGLVAAFFGTVELVTILLFMILKGSPAVFLVTLSVAIVAVAVLIYLIPRLKNVEFDYSVVDNTLVIDKVINSNKRKKLARVEISTIEAFGKLSDNDIPVYKYGRERDASSGIDEDSYYCVYTSDKGKCLLIFSPSEKILNGMKHHLSRELVIKHFYKK